MIRLKNCSLCKPTKGFHQNLPFGVNMFSHSFLGKTFSSFQNSNQESSPRESDKPISWAEDNKELVDLFNDYQKVMNIRIDQLNEQHIDLKKQLAQLQFFIDNIKMKPKSVYDVLWQNCTLGNLFYTLGSINFLGFIVMHCRSFGII